MVKNKKYLRREGFRRLRRQEKDNVLHFTWKVAV